MGRAGGSVRQVLRDERAVGLIESSIAALLIAVAFFGITAALATGMRVIGSSRQRGVMVAAAQSQLESIRGFDYDDVALDAPLTFARIPPIPASARAASTST